MALAYDAGMDSSTGATLDTDRDSVLETVLGAYRMRVEITADVRYCGTWYDSEPATHHGQFHLVTQGCCWISGEALETPVNYFYDGLAEAIERTEAAGAAYMKQADLVISVDLGIGAGAASVWTCDLTHRYIEINADYRS